MRKNLFLFVMLLCISLVYTSCDKDDSGGLTYSNWNGYKESGQRISIHFKEDDWCVKSYHYDKTKPLRATYKYKCKGNEIEIYLSNSVYFTGTISGKTMTLEIDGETIVFTRD